MINDKQRRSHALLSKPNANARGCNGAMSHVKSDVDNFRHSLLGLGAPQFNVSNFNVPLLLFLATNMFFRLLLSTTTTRAALPLPIQMRFEGLVWG
jgi:hypothetical protein